jgi:hypothetical protein
VIADAEVAAKAIPLNIAQPISHFHRIWPVAGLVAAMVVNAAWMSFLGYGFFKLVGSAFF